MRFAPLLLLALIGCRPLDAAVSPAAAMEPERAGPEIVEGGTAMAHTFGVIDGDTFRLGEEVIRISNIDAPEMPPRSRCWAEARLAREATLELQRIQAEAPRTGRQRITREGKDQYGRTLARVSYDGVADAGELMIARGYAVPRVGHRWDWCGPVTNDPNGARVVRPGPSVAATLLGEPGRPLDFSDRATEH